MKMRQNREDHFRQKKNDEKNAARLETSFSAKSRESDQLRDGRSDRDGDDGDERSPLDARRRRLGHSVGGPDRGDLSVGGPNRGDLSVGGPDKSDSSVGAGARRRLLVHPDHLVQRVVRVSGCKESLDLEEKICLKPVTDTGNLYEAAA